MQNYFVYNLGHKKKRKKNAFVKAGTWVPLCPNKKVLIQSHSGGPRCTSLWKNKQTQSSFQNRTHTDTHTDAQRGTAGEEEVMRYRITENSVNKKKVRKQEE